MRLLLAALLVAATLGGCLDEAEPNHDEDHGLLVPEDAMAEDNTAADTPNTAPTAALVVAGDAIEESDANGTFYSVAIGGNVTFTVTLSDAESDELQWSLDVDGGDAETEGTAFADNGTYGPVAFTTAYAASGDYAVTFTVTDATEDVAVEALVRVADPTPVGSPFTALEFSGTVDLPCLACGGNVDGSFSYQSGSQGFDLLWYELPPEAEGQPFLVESTGGDPDVVFYDACEGSPIADFQADGAEAGTVPAGAGCLYVYEFETPDSTITSTIG